MTRDGQFRSLAKFVRTLTEPVILMGDLNATPFSPAFVDFLRASRLRDSRLGYGNQATWPAALRRAGIAIDHCLVSPQVQVTGRQIGGDVGSDHLPVIVDLSLTDPHGTDHAPVNATTP